MIEIRSYRRVFELERRIYRIDRLRLNPGGVPVRGIVYFLLLAAAGLLAGNLPGLSAAARVLPWYARLLALPGLLAALLTVIRIEGRPFHLAAHALLRYHLQPHALVRLERRASTGSVWPPVPLLLLPDGSDGRLRRLRYTGPGAALVTVEHERITSGRRGLRSRAVTIRPRHRRRALAQAEVLALSRRARLQVEPATRGQPVRARGGESARAPARPGAGR